MRGGKGGGEDVEIPKLAVHIHHIQCIVFTGILNSITLLSCTALCASYPYMVKILCY